MAESRVVNVVRARWLFAQRVFLRARSWWAVPGLTLAFLGYWRDEGPSDLQPPLVSSLVGLLPWWGWIIVTLGVLMLVVLEGSYRLVAQTDPSLIVTDERREIPLDEMGILDYVPEHVRAIQAFTKRLRRLSQKQSSATRLMNYHNNRMQATSDVHRRQRIAGQVARIIDGQSDELESALPVLREKSERFIYALDRWLNSSVVESNEDLTSLESLRASSQLFLDNLKGSIDAITGWKNAARGLRERNTSAAINRACMKMEGLLAAIIDTFKQIEVAENATATRLDSLLLEDARND